MKCRNEYAMHDEYEYDLRRTWSQGLSRFLHRDGMVGLGRIFI